uniref:Uncharacterized protein n=1 Tax=Spongospora subterranea TaxID=70186 RepID=A0A0H5RQ41_9EUKA|eukprot:CRZ10819.1 hypothetical protein [Spongospora subterranea]
MSPSLIIISILVAGAYAKHKFIDFIHTQAELIFQDPKMVYCPFTNEPIISDPVHLFIQLDQVLQYKDNLKSQPTVNQVAKDHSETWNDIVEQIRILDEHLSLKSADKDGVLDTYAKAIFSSVVRLLERYDTNVDVAVHNLAFLLTRFATNPEEFLDVTGFPEEDDGIRRPSTSASIPSILLLLEARHYISSHFDYYQQQFESFYSDAGAPMVIGITGKGSTKKDLVQHILGERYLFLITPPLPHHGLYFNVVSRFVDNCRTKWGLPSHVAVNLVAYLSGLDDKHKNYLKSGSNLPAAPSHLKEDPSPSWHPAIPALPRSPSFIELSLPSSSNAHVKDRRSPRVPVSPLLRQMKMTCRSTAHKYESLDDLVKQSQTVPATVC